MTRKLIYFGAVTAVAAAIALAMLEQGKQKRVWRWDFSTSHRTDQVPWPKGKSADDEFADFNIDGKVSVALPYGKHFERYVRGVTFARNGGSILAVSFYLESQTTEEVHLTAMALAREWGLRTAPLDKWYRWATTHPVFGPGIAPQSATRDNKRPQTVSLEIFHSYNDERPFRIMFQLGWRDALPVPSTGPSTAPASEQKPISEQRLD